MFPTKSLTAAAAAFALISSSTADYNPSGKGNTAVYWGAGGYQLPLTSYCYDDSIDIIPIAFINSFPAQANGLVGVGMASNTCNNSPKYAGPGYGGNPPNPANDEMWTDCSPLANALYECQQNTKTKFLLSLGGAYGNYNLNNASDGVNLANLLWGMFGPYDPAWVAGGGIRPFDVSPTQTIEFDGFDFDIETSPNNQDGYVAAINQLRILFEAHNKKTGCNKEYLITGAPQCPFPDAHMSQMIDAAPFDIIWPQFYNNPGCSARNWVSNGATSGFNFGKWQTDLLTGASKHATLYIGLLGGEQGSTSFPGDYLNPTEAKNLLAAYASQPAFGGVMIWDAISSNGTDSPLTGYKYRDGTPIPATAAYYDVIKDLLGAYSTPYAAPAPVCSTSSSSTSSSTKTSTTSSSTSTTSSSTTTTSSAAASTTSSSSSTSSSVPTTTGAPVHQPSVTADGITCVRIGCYTEGYNIRALTPYATTNYALMSPEICAANCNVYPYAFIGVEYGGECYCGNQINNGSTIVADSECNMPCDGFPGEYCGAGDRLDMYRCGPAGTSSTSSAAPTTSSSSATSTTSSTAATASTSSAAASSTSSSTSSAGPRSTSSSTSPAASSTTSSSSSSYPAAPSSSSSTSSSAPAAPSSSASSYPVSKSTSTSSPAVSSSTVSSAPGSYPSSSSSIPSYPSNSSVITGSSYPTTTTYPGSRVSSTSSTPELTITETRTTTTVRTISSCAPTVTNCPYGQVLTDTIVLTTTYCPGNPTPSTSTAAAMTTSPVQYTTSTVYRTTVYTVTSCAPTVTNCPAKIGQVTTETVIDYTTVCPVTATETGASWSQTNTYYTWTTSSTTTQYVTVKVVPSTATLVPYPVSSAASVLTLNKGVASGTLPAVALYTTTAKPSQFTGAASSSRGPVAVIMAVVLGAVALLF